MPLSYSIQIESFVYSRQNSNFHYSAGTRVYNDISAMLVSNSILLETFLNSRHNSGFHYIAGTRLHNE